MILVIPESPSSPKRLSSPRKRGSPGTHAFPLPLGGVEKRLFAVIPAKAGIPELLKPVDSCLRRNDGKVEILHLSTPSLGEGQGEGTLARSLRSIERQPK